MAKLSRDQELVKRLKRRFAAYPPHDWKEQYDEQGRLLRLDLSKLRLAQLPPELWQFTSLQELEMGATRGWQSAAMRDKFWQGDDRYHNDDNNQLSSLPAELGRLVNLQELHLRGNQLSSLPTALDQLANLQELHLSGNQLSSLPAALGQLTNLKELHLDDNQLSSLPAELGQLTNLKELHLYFNQLSSLPAELGQLANLQELDLSNNQLSSLPAELGQLTNLRWLYLSGNQLSSLPAELGQLTNLYTLRLNGNQLSSLPAELGQLANLQSLDLRDNQLSSLPAELGQLASLKDLYLSRDPQLQIPPPEVVQQGTPAVLAYLRALPQAAERFEAKLSLVREGETVVLSLNMAQLSRDRELVERLKQQFAAYPSHDWKEQYDEQGRLLKLDLDRLKLTQLPPELWQFASLQSLDLHDNQLSSLAAELGQLANLQSLYLYGNQLSSLPTELGQLTNLRWLYLNSNQLSSLPAELGQLTNLQKLVLYSNKFSSLPAELGQLTNLQTLHLGNNQLSSLPTELGQLASLRGLDLSGNPQLQIPPPEVVRRGTPVVLAYLRALLPAKEMLPIKIFYCYAHEDKDLRDRIDKHLSVLRHLGHIVGWYDREIQAGTEWEHEIEENLGTAHIILLLVSADFVASDYCYGVEMQKALELHRTGQARVLPILLRSVDWQDAPFATLQMLPTGAKPIMQWKDQDEAMEDVAKGIRNVVSSLRSQKR